MVGIFLWAKVFGPETGAALVAISSRKLNVKEYSLISNRYKNELDQKEISSKDLFLIFHKTPLL
jgi:hypothetical protein